MVTAKSERKLVVLGIGAHPDDLEIACGGTLAKFSQLGHQVVMGVVCEGDKGHRIIPPQELANIRSEESRGPEPTLMPRYTTWGLRTARYWRRI